MNKLGIDIVVIVLDTGYSQDCSKRQAVPTPVVAEVEDSMADSVELEHVAESKQKKCFLFRFENGKTIPYTW